MCSALVIVSDDISLSTYCHALCCYLPSRSVVADVQLVLLLGISVQHCVAAYSSRAAKYFRKGP